MKIALLVLSKMNKGGTTTYTAHLARTLMLEGHEVQIRKIGRGGTRPYAYGLSYTSSSAKELLSEYALGAILITVIEKGYETEGLLFLSKRNVGIVFHDPKILRHIPFINEWRHRAVRIRDNNRIYIPESVYIPHPYVRNPLPPRPRTVHARSIARIDFEKHTEVLLEANRHLPPELKIDIKGAENRLYSRLKLLPDFPEWVQGSGVFPSEEGIVEKMMSETKFLVDMSYIKGDGGGTQYTFLEAMDQGAVCVLSKDWFRDVDRSAWEIKPSIHCRITEPVGSEVAERLQYTPDTTVERVREAAIDDILPLHDPSVIGPRYTSFLERLV